MSGGFNMDVFLEAYNEVYNEYKARDKKVYDIEDPEERLEEGLKVNEAIWGLNKLLTIVCNKVKVKEESKS